MEYTDYEHKVQYYETDLMGCVHHSNYIRWFEEARTAYLERMDMGYDRMEAAGIISPVLEVEAQYRSMTRYGENVKISMKIVKYNGIRLQLEYQIRDRKDGTVRCTGKSSHCFLDRNGRPVSLKKAQPVWDRLLRDAMDRSEEQLSAGSAGKNM